jgi:hypothetical protein
VALATEHEWNECDRDDCYPCMWCEGGLAYCVRCGAFEGATTTDCPREPVGEGRWQDVYAGLVDYRAGEWRAECSRHTPAYWSTPAGRAEIEQARTTT